MNSPAWLMTAAIAALTLTACEEKPSDARSLLNANPPPTDISPDAGAQMPPPPRQMPTLKLKGNNGMLHISLPEPTCTQRTEALITWDASSVGKTAAELWVGPEGQRQIVAAGAAIDESVIPGWAAPGQIFTLRESGGGQELDMLVIPGAACP